MHVLILYFITLSISLHLDQLNTTIHGIMKCSPYKLVYGQPARHNVFLGAEGSGVMEENVGC